MTKPPKVCEVCGETKGKINNNKKSGKVLCNRHRFQYERHGEFFKRTVYDPNKFIINNDTIEITLYNIKGVEVAKALVDVDKYSDVVTRKWKLDGNGYVSGLGFNKDVVLLHRFIMNAPKGMCVDHKNHNKLDNRGSNLRICTGQQNSYNQPISKKNTSGYVGISWDSKSKAWDTRINIDTKYIRLGRFKDINEAIKARKEAEIKYYGEFANRGESA